MNEARIEDIGACVFDAYGTLFDFNAAAKRCRDELGDKAGPLSALWRTKQMAYTWQRSLPLEPSCRRRSARSAGLASNR